MKCNLPECRYEGFCHYICGCGDVVCHMNDGHMPVSMGCMCAPEPCKYATKKDKIKIEVLNILTDR